MKYLLLLLLSVASVLGGYAQIDSARQAVNLTFKARHHQYVLGFLDDAGSADIINYVNAVRQSIDSTQGADQNISVQVPVALVLDMLRVIGDQPNRISATYNAEIRAAILPQLSQNAYLSRMLSAQFARDAAETATVVTRGKNYVYSIKKLGVATLVPPNANTPKNKKK